ncbi:MAG: phosphoglucosamine mutase [Candidatus Saccharibacteria bacterium]
MGRYFGTDGVRGVANRELTPELAYQLGRAGAYVLTLEAKHPRILVGKDTRISGDMLESALVAGICSTGADALRAGVIPTPAVAYLTQKYEATCGVVISASHNPMQDNGIKFFGSSGNKLPDEVEEEIENIMLANLDAAGRPEGADIGRVYDIESAERNYIDYLINCYKPSQNLEGMTIVVDCANGAAFNVAPQMWRELGATVIPIFNKPNGININDRCGSTHPEALRKAVVEHKANVGIAHDGDADRLIAVDERGNVIDGDQIMVVCGLHMQRTGRLQPSKVVATVMSNIGLEIAFRRERVEIASCSVGDRYVLERMQETGARLGGEQSGHIIFLDYATTGDGLLSSLKLVEVMRETGMPLSELAREMEKHPQILINLDIKDKDTILNNVGVQDAIRGAQERLGECGKVLVRPSGTEPKVRIMAQGPDETLLQEVVNDIKDAVLKA